MSLISPTNRSLRFVHIPKTGGTSIVTSLKERYKDQYTYHQHAHFLTMYAEDPGAVFGIVYRDPASVLISFYNYVNMRKMLPQKMRGDFLWLHTFRKDPVTWAQNPTIQAIFDQFLLQQLSASVSEAGPAGDYMARHFKELRLPTAPAIKPWIDVRSGVSSYVRAMSSLPPQYACADHVQVAVTLLTRFSAVGVLENLGGFYTVLFHRMEDHSGDAVNNSSNVTGDAVKVGRESTRASMRARVSGKAAALDEQRNQSPGIMSATDSKKVRDILSYREPALLTAQAKTHTHTGKSASKLKVKSRSTAAGGSRFADIPDAIALANSLAEVEAKDTRNRHADALFCSSMMWHLMKMINEADLACIR